ncbi:MAG TPA: hypothetical protein VMF55_02810 [Solirubrobacterales bacterium]|nr:hypothetical protein [Solirubrobacterales bacterium]
MDDDWRLQIDLDDGGIAGGLADHLRSAELEHDLAVDIGRRVIVSHEGSRIFLYAADREQLDSAEAAIRKYVDAKGWQTTFDLRHWHPEADEWEDPGKPLPTSEAGKEAEHEERMETEDEETAARGGRAEFEVSVKFPTSHEAREFAKKLKEEGLEPVRRFHYMVVGAVDEDAAKALAERIRAEAPADAEVKAEYSLNELYREQPPNPFFFLGGLAG